MLFLHENAWVYIAHSFIYFVSIHWSLSYILNVKFLAQGQSIFCIMKPGWTYVHWSIYLIIVDYRNDLSVQHQIITRNNADIFSNSPLVTNFSRIYKRLKFHFTKFTKTCWWVCARKMYSIANALELLCLEMHPNQVVPLIWHVTNHREDKMLPNNCLSANQLKLFGESSQSVPW